MRLLSANNTRRAKSHTLEKRGPARTITNMFGDEEIIEGNWVALPVHGWWIDRSSETADDSLMRVVTILHIMCKSAVAPGAADDVRLPDGTVWRVEGVPEDYNHGPWWAPGLVVVHAKQVTG